MPDDPPPEEGDDPWVDQEKRDRPRDLFRSLYNDADDAVKNMNSISDAAKEIVEASKLPTGQGVDVRDPGPEMKPVDGLQGGNMLVAGVGVGVAAYVAGRWVRNKVRSRQEDQ